MSPSANLGRIGLPIQTQQSGGPSGWSMNPGSGVTPRLAVNVYRPNQMFNPIGLPPSPNPGLLIGQQYDITAWNKDLGQSNNRMVGTSYDNTGTALGGCTVKVFTTVDNLLVATTTSDAFGNWVVYPSAQGPYYIVEYRAGPPNVFGTSDITLAATTFQPGG